MYIERVNHYSTNQYPHLLYLKDWFKTYVDHTWGQNNIYTSNKTIME